MKKETKTPERIANELVELEAHKTKIAELKVKYNVTDVFTLIIGDATAYLRKLDRKDMSAARAIGQGDELAISEAMLEICWLEGDERIKKDDDYFLVAIQQLNNMWEKKTSELKKN